MTPRLPTYLFILFLLIAGASVMAQTTTILDRFRASEIDGKVNLEWVISAGSTCNGIRIFRSTDTVEFDLIGAILGECGSITEPVLYTFLDSMPVQNRINYYRLELGGNGTSAIISIEIIDTGKDGYQIRPHPVRERGTLFFSNDSNDRCELHVYNLYGVEVHHATTDKDRFEIRTDHLPSGWYPFTLSCENQPSILYGMLVIQF